MLGALASILRPAVFEVELGWIAQGMRAVKSGGDKTRQDESGWQSLSSASGAHINHDQVFSASYSRGQGQVELAPIDAWRTIVAAAS